MQTFIWYGVEIREADCTEKKSSPWSLKLGGVQSFGSSFPWQGSWLKCSGEEVWLYGEGWNHKMALKVELPESVEAEISTGSLWFSLSLPLTRNDSSGNLNEENRGIKPLNAKETSGRCWTLRIPSSEAMHYL